MGGVLRLNTVFSSELGVGLSSTAPPWSEPSVDMTKVVVISWAEIVCPQYSQHLACQRRRLLLLVIPVCRAFRYVWRRGVLDGFHTPSHKRRCTGKLSCLSVSEEARPSGILQAMGLLSHSRALSVMQIMARPSLPPVRSRHDPPHGRCMNPGLVRSSRADLGFHWLEILPPPEPSTAGKPRPQPTGRARTRPRTRLEASGAGPHRFGNRLGLPLYR